MQVRVFTSVTDSTLSLVKLSFIFALTDLQHLLHVDGSVRDAINLSVLRVSVGLT